MARVLGVAFGPRHVHAEVRDADSGTLVATGAARHHDTGADVDDPTTWWRSLVSAVARTAQREIAAISVCGSHPGLVLLDRAGAVLRPVQPWAEAEAASTTARLRAALGAEGWARHTGFLPGPTAAVSRLAWLRNADPATFGLIGTVLLPHDWLTYRLAGRLVTDRGSASLTGAWSPTLDDWSPEVLDELSPEGARARWRDRLPALLGPSEQADWLDAPTYELLGLRGRPLVGPGTGEAMAVALALGIGPGRPGVSIGERTIALCGLDRPTADPTGAVASHADASGRHLAVAAAGTGTILVDTIRALLDVDHDGLDALAAGAGDRDGALVLLPEVAGRSGALVAGLTPAVDRAGLAHAVFEGIACAALDALDAIANAGAAWPADSALRLAVADSHADAHARSLADLSGRAVHVLEGASPAATGACVQAAAVLTGTPPHDVAAAWHPERAQPVEPRRIRNRAARRARHAEERARQRRALTPRS